MSISLKFCYELENIRISLPIFRGLRYRYLEIPISGVSKKRKPRTSSFGSRASDLGGVVFPEYPASRHDGARDRRRNLLNYFDTCGPLTLFIVLFSLLGHFLNTY
ncbi:hypothetical protein CEXT_612991 [Caerostris extrusa]|uniref:Uncharacterized protein n=1 Tax=Caerostris extrusa TaxID=172846 RepID=A0AAV4V2G9_CAEEX|nr:hypothetical protein CEXT_612991 [Caerostris extrusa]